MIRITQKYCLLFLLGYVLAYTNNETNWEYTQGTQQGFYMFENINIDGTGAVGDGQPANNYSGECINNLNTCDVIGAFIQRDETEFGDINGDGEISSSVDVCVGWIYASSEGWTTVPLIGTVPGDVDLSGYLDTGDIPIFKIYDHNNNSILPLGIENIYYTEYFTDTNENGEWDIGQEAEPFTDNNDNGQWDDDELFTDTNENGEWDEGEYFYDGNGVYDEGEEFTDGNDNGQWDEGEEFIDIGNGTYDYAESFEDINNNGIYDVFIQGESFEDINDNGIYDDTVEGDLLGWSYNEIFLYGGSIDAYNIYGCNDAEACNYEFGATANNGSCVYSPSGALAYEVVVENNNIEFSWNSPSSGTPEFQYQVKLFNDSNIEIFNEYNSVSPLFFNDLDWSMDYTIEVTITNFDSCESLVSIISVTTDLMPAPDQVVLDNPISGEGEIFLSWNSVEYGSIYRIYSNDSIVDSTSLTIYVDDELEPDITNSYEIQAINMEGTEGSISEPVVGSTLPLSSASLDSVVVGRGQLEILWSMENSELSYANQSYVFDIYMNDDYLTTRYGTYHIVNNLDADEEYCFYVIPRVELVVDGENIEFTSSQSNSICASPDDISGWSILIESQLNAWESELIYDIYNELGMKPEASDNYDSELDIPEPPVTGGLDYWVSLSFPHPEWNLGIGGVPQEYFTSDLRGLRDLSKTIEIWDVALISSAPGSGLLSFNFISDAGGYPIYLRWNNQYTRIYDDSVLDFVYNTPEEEDGFKIIAGNQLPSIPTSLDVASESREILITWDENIECEGSNEGCNSYSNRYPATSYKVYRSWYEETNPHIISLIGTRENKISILPIHLNSTLENSFNIVDQPVDGYIESEYFESYLDANFNDEYDSGEEFSDCGWDGLCPGDYGYDSEEFTDENENDQYDLGEEFIDSNFNDIWDENGPDIGENDGICNGIYYYQANEYFIEGYDSLSYLNNAYDYGEDYIDDNSNGEWNDDEEFSDAPRFLKIKITEDLESSYIDLGLNTGTLYFYNVVASNGAGESSLSMTDSDETAPNIRPTADAGIDQTRYIISANDTSVDCTFPLDNVYDDYGNEVLDDLGNPVLDNINNSFDPDGLPQEPLIYHWEIYDPDATLNLEQLSIISNDSDWWIFGSSDVSEINLPETADLLDQQYLVRLYVQDISGYISVADSTSIKVTRDVPIPSSVDFSIDEAGHIVVDESLYYIKLFWNESSYDAPGQGDNQAPDGYDGELKLADYYVIYRDSIEHQTVSSDTLFFVDSGLPPQEFFVDENSNEVWDYGEDYIDFNSNGSYDDGKYCYYIIAVNGTGESSPSGEECFRTGELPIPEITSPSGGEILTSGETEIIAWNIVDSNIQFIESISVYHSSDAGTNWELEGSWAASSGIPVFFEFTVPETNTISFYNKFKVEVLDIGDYGGINNNAHIDLTDHLIIIANDNLEHNYSSGWNIVSSPLELESTNVWDNFMGDDDGILNFLIYSEDGEVCGFPQCDDQLFDFQIGEGFYMISQQNSTLGLQGDILESQLIALDQGWNLIGNPLVAKVIVDSLSVIKDGNLYSWSEAVDYELVLPMVHGFSNESRMHKPMQVLEPFYGYWVYAVEALELSIEPHIYDESLYIEQREDHFKLTLYAEEHEPHPAMLDLLWNDMIQIGLSPDASDGMIYNEDQYDIPVTVNPASFTNIFIDHPEWESSGMAESRRFFSDSRALEGPDVAKTWNLTGQLLGNVISDSLVLYWNMNNLDLLTSHDITLVVGAGQEIIDMRDRNSVVIDKEYFENMQITIGPLIDSGSCEAQGLVECEDGTCVTLYEDCVDLSNGSIPIEFSLSRPYPNPFNPSVSLDFSISETQIVDINIYNLNGEQVENIMNGMHTVGHYSISWDASSYPTGVYFIQFSSKESVKTMKVMLIK